MLEKPDLPDESLIACLHDDYGLAISELSFLPLGADVDTVVYRAVARDGTPYFVKLRRGEFDGTTVLIPQRLSEIGIKQINAPIVTDAGQAWTRVEGFTVVLYPFVEGEIGFGRHLSDRLWVDLGVALKGPHTAVLPDGGIASLQHETYSS